MTLRDLLSAYAADMLLKLWIYDKSDSAFCLWIKFEDGAGHDFEIFEKYSDATILEWYVTNDKLNVLLDIEKF